MRDFSNYVIEKLKVSPNKTNIKDSEFVCVLGNYLNWLFNCNFEKYMGDESPIPGQWDYLLQDGDFYSEKEIIKFLKRNSLEWIDIKEWESNGILYATYEIDGIEFEDALPEPIPDYLKP